MARIERQESDIMRALTEIIRKDVKHPDIRFITITEVDLTKDLSYLTIYYTALTEDEEKRAKLSEALERTKPFIRGALAKKVKLRKMPALRFKYDATLDKANRLERGLKAVIKDDEKKDNEE